jgi:hypothetical protein
METRASHSVANFGAKSFGEKYLKWNQTSTTQQRMIIFMIKWFNYRI